MIEKVILDYLNDNRRIVVPRLGAFMKRDDGNIVFAPFLNKDDGILTGLVRESSAVSAAEAAVQVERYAEAVIASVSVNGFYEAEGLGVLRRDANGILFLDTDPSQRVANRSPRAEAMPRREIAPEPESQPEPKPEPVREAATSPAPVADSVVSPTVSAKKPLFQKIKIEKDDKTEEAAKRKPDLVFTIAVIVAIIAIASMLYGYFILDMPVFNLK